MKTLQNTVIVLAVLLLVSCGSEKKETGLPTIDLTKSYSKKEIVLQDIADVEYIPLETTDSSLIGRNYYVVPAGKDKILVYDDGRSSGDILLFDTQGKFINKFNHKGQQTGQEYIHISEVLVDSKNQEIFIVPDSRMKIIQVYTMSGQYKRTLKYDAIEYFESLILGEGNQLICYQDLNIKHAWDKDRKQQATFITALNKQISKIDTIFDLPTTKGVDVICTTNLDGRKLIDFKRPPVFVNSPEGIVVNEVSYDTIFTLNSKLQLKPLIARTPKVSPADDPMKMFAVDAVTKDHLYVEVKLKKCEFGDKDYYKTLTYQMQRKDNQIFEYTLKNADVPSLRYLARLEEYYLISADNLKELLEEGKLKGKLKQVAEKLKEDDNPVVMKVTLKK